MELNTEFHLISTMIETIVKDKKFLGSGFFYLEYGEKNQESPQWTAIKENWLVTNRHILLPKIEGKETVPDKINFYLRRINENKISWIPIELNKKEFIERAKFHSDSSIDVGIVKILDIETELLKKEIKKQEQEKPDDKGPHRSNILQTMAMSKEKLPGNNKIKVEVSDDVIIIGYPQGFYDEKNIFPIVKSGIIASKWGAFFNGNPYFLIDAKLFPGSSGSLVLSKPTNVSIESGKVYTAAEKQFAFLGIFSGELYRERQLEKDGRKIKIEEKFDVGAVWYGFLIDEIIYKGKPVA